MNNASDLELIQAIFKSPEKSNKLIDSFKPAFIGGIIAVALSLPIITKFIGNFGINSEITIYLIKFIIFVVLFYIIGQKKQEELN